MEEIKETSSSPPMELSAKDQGMSTNTKVGIAVGVVVGLIILILVLVFLLNNPDTTSTLRDLFIIVLAFESIVIGTLLVILVYQLITLTRMLRDEIKPMIESTQDTVNTVKGTATFVSQRVTKPAIQVSGYAAGIARSVSVLIAMLPRRRSSTSESSSTEEAAPQSGQGDEA
jgi:uncharacterized integral membrane protein